MIKEITANENLVKPHHMAADNKLKKTCADFESIFLTYMLKSMKTTSDQNGLLGNSNDSKIIKSMFDETLALGIAKSGGIGLGKMLFEAFRDQNSGSAPDSGLAYHQQNPGLDKRSLIPVVTEI